MRTKTIELFQFDELSDEAKEKARDWWRKTDLEVQDASNQIQEDAEQIGLRIKCLDDNRPNEGEFAVSARHTMRTILAEHGNMCETYKTAQRYQFSLEKDDETEAYENSAHEFLHDLLEDYRVMLNKEIEYRYSNECIDESIRANEYEFTIDGKRS